MAEVKPTKEQLAKVMQDLSPADRKILEAHLKGGGRSRRMSEEEILLKRKHAIKGTLRFNDKTNKQEMDFQCQHPGCETIETVATSDLFQVNMCEEHKKEQAKAKKAERDAKVKAILAKAAATEA